MDSMELSEWIAFSKLMPLPCDKEDILNAINCSATVNSFGGKTSPEDFIPKWIAEKHKVQSPDEIYNILKKLYG